MPKERLDGQRQRETARQRRRLAENLEFETHWLELDPMPSRRLGFTSLLVCSLTVLAPQPAEATDTLSVPMFGDEREQLWPVELSMEVVNLDTGMSPIPVRSMIVADGHHMNFTHVARTSRGRRSFDVALVARHHAEDAVELEYDVTVSEAAYASMQWGEYLLHRLNLGPGPHVGREFVSFAKADIVSTHSNTLRERFVLEGEHFEIRLFARPLRG
jgi:hypothetical protein